MSARAPTRWNVAAAKARFSEVIARAARRPQIIANRNREVAVVLDAATFRKSEAARTAAEPAARLRRFLELSARLRVKGGGAFRVPRRSSRRSPFSKARDL